MVRLDGGIDLSRWPMVGRTEQLAAAIAMVAEGRGVVLVGASGVGKTRLAREVVVAAEGRGSRTAWIAATRSAASVPFAAVAHLLPLDGLTGGRDDILRSAVAAIDNERDRGPLVLGIDDAHLLDDASAVLVRRLATAGAATVVMSIRSGEVPPDPVAAIWKEGAASVVEMQTLERTEVDELVADVLGGPVDNRLLHSLWTSSTGNPLYLRELIRNGIESGALQDVSGVWRWKGRITPNERIRELVWARLGALTTDEREVLDLIAVGEPLPLDAAHRLGAVEIAGRLEQRGIVSADRSAREVRLAHPLYGEVVRDQMAASRLDEVRLQLADAVGAMTPLSETDSFRAVLWRAEAGDRTHPEALCAAARRAWAMWAAPVAEQLARAALECAPNLEAHYLLGEALSDQGRPDEALAAWEAADSIDGSDLMHANVAMARASTLNYQRGDRAAADAVLVDALRRLHDPAARKIVAGARAMFHATRPVAERPPVIDADDLSPSGTLAAVLQHAMAGENVAATRLADAAIAGSAEWAHRFPTALLLLRIGRCWATMLAGEVLEAEAEVERWHATAVAEGVDYPRVTWGLLRGIVAILRGHRLLAEDHIRQVVAVSSHDDRGWQLGAHTYLAQAAALGGQPLLAEEHLRKTTTAIQSIEGVFGVDTARARAWTIAARGRHVAAADAAELAAEHGLARGQRPLAALALHDVARFGRPRSVVATLEDLCRQVDGPLVPALAAHARALAAADGPALDTCAEQFTIIGLDLFAAEASAAAARAYERDRRRGLARTARERSRAFEAEHGPLSTPLLAGGEPGFDLTGREREVAKLAARGESSRAIAEQLDISHRTVDNLLGRVYTKLAIASREELGSVFPTADDG